MSPLRTALALGGFVVLALSGVAAVHELTREQVAEQRERVLTRELREVLPDAVDNEPLAEAWSVANPVSGAVDESMTVYPARQDGRRVGTAVRVTTPHGYSGRIELLIGVDREGRVRAVRTLEHRETPGLGDAIDAGRSGWVEQFEGRQLGNPPREEWRLDADGGAFDAITGATRSARAVTEAVRAVLEALESAPEPAGEGASDDP